MGKSISLMETEQKATTAKMVNKIAFLGVTHPEILAEGFCPNCITMVDLWITSHGLELSLHGREYRVEPSIEIDQKEKRAYQPSVKSFSGSKNITIEDPSFHKEQLSLIAKITDLLLMPISCPINFKRSIFFVLLIFASIALLTQGLYYFWPVSGEVQLISLSTNWAIIIRNLFLVLLGLSALNFLSYKAGFSDSGPAQIDKWTLGSSIVAFSYCLLSSIILPLLLISHLNIAIY